MIELSKIYSIKPIRLAIKFGICLLGVKVAGDFFFYMISGQTLTFPRYVINLKFRHIKKALSKVLQILQ